MHVCFNQQSMDFNEDDSILITTSQICTFRRQSANFFDFEDDDEIKNQDDSCFEPSEESRPETELKIDHKQKKSLFGSKHWLYNALFFQISHLRNFI